MQLPYPMTFSLKVVISSSMSIMPHIWHVEWPEDGGHSLLYFAFTITGEQVCGLHVEWPENGGRSRSWSGWHGSWNKHSRSVKARFHWRGSWSKRCVTRVFYILSDKLMHFWKGQHTILVQNRGVIVDRTRRKMLEYKDDDWEHLQ